MNMWRHHILISYNFSFNYHLPPVPATAKTNTLMMQLMGFLYESFDYQSASLGCHSPSQWHHTWSLWTVQKYSIQKLLLWRIKQTMQNIKAYQLAAYKLCVYSLGRHNGHQQYMTKGKKLHCFCNTLGWKSDQSQFKNSSQQMSSLV